MPASAAKQNTSEGSPETDETCLSKSVSLSKSEIGSIGETLDNDPDPDFDFDFERARPCWTATDAAAQILAPQGVLAGRQHFLNRGLRRRDDR